MQEYDFNGVSFFYGNCLDKNTDKEFYFFPNNTYFGKISEIDLFLIREKVHLADMPESIKKHLDGAVKNKYISDYKKILFTDDPGILIEVNTSEEKPEHHLNNNIIITQDGNEFKKIGSFRSFLLTLEKIKSEEKNNDYYYFYRGQANEEYDLTPSVFRKNKKHESIIYREFTLENSNDFSDSKSCFDNLVKMQHYSLPTRLLDLTTNPLIALYFACEIKKKSDRTDCNNCGKCRKCKKEPNGEFFILKIKKDKVRYYDSDTISCVSNIAKLSYEQQSLLQRDIAQFKTRLITNLYRNYYYDNISKSEDNTSISINDLCKNYTSHIKNSEMENTDPYDMKLLRDKLNTDHYQLLHFIKNEKPYFLDKINPLSLSSPIIAKARKNNARMVSQSGLFLLFGLTDSLDKSYNGDFQVYSIKIHRKEKILQELDNLNINKSTIFPEMEKSAEYIKEKFKDK